MGGLEKILNRFYFKLTLSRYLCLYHVKIKSMDNIIQADIFFFISSVAVIVFTICTVIVMIYVTRILRDMKHISQMMSQESDKLLGDIGSLRETIEEEGAKVKTIANFFLKIFTHRRKNRDLKKTHK